MWPQQMFSTIPYAARGLCHHQYPPRVKSYARPPYLSSFCLLLVSGHKKGDKNENLAHPGQQKFSHACLRTLHWPINLCDAAFRHGIWFTRLRSTNMSSHLYKRLCPSVHLSVYYVFLVYLLCLSYIYIKYLICIYYVFIWFIMFLFDN